MTKGFKANFHAKYSDNKHDECGVMKDNESDAMVCATYADLRVELDLTKDADLVK